MKKGIGKLAKFACPLCIAALSVVLLLSNASVTAAAPSITVPDRMAGETAYDTSMEIVKTYAQGQKLQNVILASGKTFPDALSASTLSKKLNAPILLVGMTVNDDGSKKVLQYLETNLASGAAVYIMGGTGIISGDFDQAVRNIGAANVVRLGGQTLYDTNMQIVNEVAAQPGTPVIVASGERFPDALSASSIAGNKGWPILLVDKTLPNNDTIAYISKNHPTNIYVVGGSAIIPDTVVNAIQSASATSSVQRISGQTLYDTSGAVAKEFSPSPTDIYLANGNYFPDALAGSSLASLDGSPILLVDHLTHDVVPDGIVSYLQTLKNNGINPKIHVLGGTFVVSDRVVQNVKNVLAGDAQVVNPLPNWTPPTITGTAGSDQKANNDIIVKELGLKENNFENRYYGAIFNVEGADMPGLPALVTSNMGGSVKGLDAVVSMNYWGYNPQYPDSYKLSFLASEMLRFYLPTGYTQVIDIVNAHVVDHHPDNYNIFKTILDLDGREVIITASGRNVYISKPGETINPSDVYY